MVEERRQYARLIPDSPVFVCLGESKSGLLLDLSEGGLAVDGFASQSREELISLALDLPEGNGRIPVRAEVAWTSDSTHRTGLRFVDLADTSRQQLKDWISTRAYTISRNTAEEGAAAPLLVTPEGEALVSGLRSALVPLQLTRESEPTEPHVMGDEESSRNGKSRRLIGICLAGALVSSASVSVGYYLGRMWDHPQVREVTAAAKVPESSSHGSTASVNPSPATTPSLPPTLSLDLPGFVLQVGAMTYEDNADALAEALHQKNLPAFVFRHGADHFYRVAVGPYSDADSTAPVKDELAKQGFKAILRRWVPE